MTGAHRRRRALRRLAAATSCGLVVIFAWAALAAAQDNEDLQVTAVDARSDTPRVELIYGGPADIDQVEVTQNGEQRPVESVMTLEEADVETRGVVVVDNSELLGNGPVQKELAAVESLAPGDSELDETGLVAVGGGSDVAADLTVSAANYLNAVDKVAVDGNPALWDGLLEAGDLLADETDGVNNNIIIVTGTDDIASEETFSTASAAIADAEATVYVVNVDGRANSDGMLQRLVEDQGGIYLEGGVDDLDDYVGQVNAAIGNQYAVTFQSAEVDGLVDLTVSLGEEEVALTYTAGRVNANAESLRFADAAGGGALSTLFENDVVKYVVIVLVLVAVAMFAYSVMMLVQRDTSGLSYVLQPYDALAADPDLAEEESGGRSLTNAAIIQRAVELTSQFAESRGFLARAESALERANLPLRAAEAMLFYVVVVGLVVVLSVVLTRNVIVVLIFAGLLALLPPAVINFLARRRTKHFLSQLPDTLQLLSGTLRAGYSIMQGFEAVSQEVAEPMGKELRRVVTEARLGRPLEDALEAVAERMDSQDFAWAVMAIRIQREVGGNLAELLLTVAETMTARERLRRDVSALTAEGRVSALVLGILPLGLAGAMYFINPGYISQLWQKPMGIVMLIAAAVMMVAGFAWMKKIIEIEI